MEANSYRPPDSPPEDTSTAPPGPPTAGVALRPVLGLFSAGAIVVGGVIGSGIFLKPSQIARDTQGYLGLILLLWFICGIVNLCGALTLAELSAMMPHAGGTYVFLREAYGKLLAFLWAWAEFFVIRSGAIAALGVAMALFLQDLLPEGGPASQVNERAFQLSISIGTILLLAIVNILGVQWGGVVQNVTTVIKATFVLVLGMLPFLAAGTSQGEAFEITLIWPEQFDWQLMMGIGAAVGGIMWAYDGWGNVTVVAEEIRQPQRNIPLALGGGVVLLTVLYLGANLGYHLLLPLETIQSVDNPADNALQLFLGSFGSRLLTSLLLVSIFGALNTNILIGPRVIYAVARDQRALSRFSRLDPRTGTPVLAIVGLSLWAVILILLGDLSPDPEKRLFDVLTNYCVFGGSLFYLAAVLGVFVLRAKQPDAERPYRTWGYPIVPLVFIAFYIYLLVGMFIAGPRECGIGLLLVGTGLVVFPLLKLKAS